MSDKNSEAEEKNKAGEGKINGSKEKSYDQMPGFSGNIYQSKWLMWYLLKGLSSKCTFELGTEIEEAGKFDGLVFKYKKVVDGNEIDHFIIMKSKHRTNINKKITYRDVFTDGNRDFGLVKYFDLFVESKNAKMFKDGVIEHAIIYTNACFDMDEKIPNKDENWKELKNIKNITEEMKLKHGDTLSTFEIKIGKFYQFKHTLVFPVLKSMILDYKYYGIAQKLVDTLKNGKQLNKDKIWKHYNRLLLTEVIDEETKMFRADFLNESCDDVENATGRQKLRRALSKVLKDQKLSVDYINELVFKWEESFENLEQTKQSWPDIDADLEEFLKKFIFATNQPDEMTLGKFILKKLRGLYPICDEQLIHAYLMTKIQVWIKGGNFIIDKPKNTLENRFISFEDANHFFQNMIRNFMKMALKGPTVDYDCHIRKYKMNFVDPEFDRTIKTFFDSHQRILSIISEHPMISSIKLKKKIESKEFIYIILSSPNKVLLNAAIETFQSELTDHLLVIEWDCDETKLDEWSDKIRDIIDAISSHNQKKLIIVSNRNDVLEKYFLDDFFIETECLEIRDNENTLANLEKDSQVCFMDTMVKFQGADAKLRDFITNDDFKKAIDGGILQKILKKENVNIGTQIEGLKEDTQHFYIERTFMRKVENGKNMYLLIGINELDLCTENQNFEFIKKYKPSTQNEIDTFTRAVDENKPKDIYLFKKESDELIILEKSNDAFEESDFKNLMKCEHNKCEINLLTAVTGEGKSTLFAKLSQKIKNENPELWVIKIDMNSVSSKLSEIQKNICTCKFTSKCTCIIQLKNVINLLHHGAEHHNELEKTIFEHRLQNKNVELLLDGFDEVCPSYKSIILKMIQILGNEAAIKTIWINTRPYDSILNDMKETFTNFYVKHYNFEPLTEDSQKKYLKNIWQQSIEVDDEFFKLFVDELFKLFNNNIKGEFLGVPLHIMLIGNTFKDTFEKFQNTGTSEISTEQRRKLSEMVDLPSLYDKFVRFKCEIFFEDKFHLNLDTWKGKVILCEYLKNHKILALDSLLNENELKTLLTETEIKELKEYKNEIEESGDVFGIANRIVDGKPQFIHRTFAEYFVAMFFIENMKGKEKKSQKIAEYFLENMINDENSVICDFIDSKLNNEPNLTEYSGKYRSVVKKMDGGKLYFVLERTWQNIGEILINNGICMNYEHHGETILHSASKLERLNDKKSILSLIFEKKDYKKNGLKSKLLTRGNYQRTPLSLAIICGRLENVKTIYEMCEKMKILNYILMDETEQGENIMHLAVNSECDDDFFTKLLNLLKSEPENLKTILTKMNNVGETPFDTAVKYGQKNKFDAMWNLFKELDVSIDSVLFNETKNHGNIMHLAATNDCNYDCFTHLLKSLPDFLKTLMTEKNSDGYTPFDIVVINGEWNKFEAILKLFNDLDISKDNVLFNKNEHGENIIHLAVNPNCNDIFFKNLLHSLKREPEKLKILLSEKNIDDHTPFHIAVMCNQRNKFQIMWDLCEEQKISTDSIFFNRTKRSQNIIHLAASSDCNNDFLVYLVNLLISGPDKLKSYFINKKHI